MKFNAKNSKLLIVLLSVLLCAYCSYSPEATITEEIDVGLVVTVNYVPMTFTTGAKTELETDKGIFVLNGTVSVIKGSKATMRTYSDNRQYLCLEGKSTCQHIWGA